MAQPTITALLRELSAGSPGALDRLMPALYDDLRRVARRELRRELPGHTFDSVALIHEAWLRLRELRQIALRDRGHFLAVSARVMRRVLTDHARARRRNKRGGGVALLSLGAADRLRAVPPDELLELDETLTRLEQVNARACRVVECRCFGGMSVIETAAALRISPATVKRDWMFSRAWLNRALGRPVTESSAT
jgi:RNA polymerase sigma factor (TIGR02999 family)